MNRESRCWRVRGRVQGIGFRATCRAEAQRLGIVGYAHNLADGAVEVAAAGSPEALKRFEAWLERGPRGARVESLEELPAPARVLRGFELG